MGDNLVYHELGEDFRVDDPMFDATNGGCVVSKSHGQLRCFSSVSSPTSCLGNGEVKGDELGGKVFSLRDYLQPGLSVRFPSPWTVVGCSHVSN